MLLEVDLAPDLLPRGEQITSELIYVTSPPESSTTWQGLGRVDWRGVRVHHVLDGSITMRAEGDAQVLRAGVAAAPEDVPAGSEVLLGPGDTWIARNETPFEATNTTAEPTHLLMWVLANIAEANTTYIYLEPVPWTIESADPAPPGIELPEGPVTLRIKVLELPVKGRLPAAPGTIQHGVRPPRDAAGKPILDPSLGTQSNRTLVNLGRKPLTVYVLTLDPIGGDVGTPSAGTPVS
jgi:hypothetical protein